MSGVHASGPAGTGGQHRPGVPAYTIRFDGRPVAAVPGQTVAAALWAAGIRSWRTTRTTGAPRGLYCGIGACFDCLVTIDGVPNQRACLIPARPEQEVTTQLGTGHSQLGTGQAEVGGEV